MKKLKPIHLAQIGLGYWGPNLMRNLQSLPSVDVSVVVDNDAAKLSSLGADGGRLKTSTEVESALDDPAIDAVVIATPPRSHAEIARKALESGKHVLVEKPLAMTVDEGTQLVKLSRERGLVLMAGHTFLYNNAVRRLKSYIDSGELGDVYYLYSQRLNLGRVRRDVNALWNFAPHDVSILLNLVGQLPRNVSARGFAFLQPGIDDVVFMTLDFSNGVGAHVHISWLDPHKVRRMTVVGSRKMAVYDDVSPDAKIVIYDKGVDKIPTADSPRDFKGFAEFQLLPRHGDVTIPALDFPEPLKLECQHFVDCIREGKTPLTDGQSGLDVVSVLEAAQRSLDAGGRPESVTR
jgi:predicted dehydrogenase